ncbi:MAG: extracellular solute-binding protein, partial [Bifidobacteriales bacterium]|nr:extracellular solute-binding protein [Bifidobacteriales bacterium]
MSWRTRGKQALSVCAGLAMIIGLSACGGSGNSSSSKVAKESSGMTMSDVNKALKSDKKVMLNFWTWRYDIEQANIDAFQAKYPNIKVNVTQTGASSDHYTKFQNILKSGKDVPDIVQLEYDYLPQFAVTNSLLNFADKSIESDMGKLYNDAAWKNVHVADGLYGTPLDQGPEVMFVRHDVLDQFGLKVPTTWKEFEEEGVALHKADPNRYMSFVDTTDVRYMASIIRQSGAKP